MQEEKFPILPKRISFKYERNAVYVGDYQNGRYHGTGKLTLPAQNISISGNFFDGDFTKGKLSYPDGGCYEGDFTNFKACGSGKYSKNGFNFICSRENGINTTNEVKIICPDGSEFEIGTTSILYSNNTVICNNYERQDHNGIEYKLSLYNEQSGYPKWDDIIYLNESMERQRLLKGKEEVQKYPKIIQRKTDDGNLEKVIEYEDGKIFRWTKFEEDDFERPLCGEGSYRTEDNKLQITGSVSNSIFTDCEILKFTTGTKFQVTSLMLHKNKLEINHRDQLVTITSNCRRSGSYIIKNGSVDFFKGNYYESFNSDNELFIQSMPKYNSNRTFSVEGTMIDGNSHLKSIGRHLIRKHGSSYFNHGITIEDKGQVNIFSPKNKFVYEKGMVEINQKNRAGRVKDEYLRIYGCNYCDKFGWERFEFNSINYREGGFLDNQEDYDDENACLKVAYFCYFGSWSTKNDSYYHRILAFGRLNISENLKLFDMYIDGDEQNNLGMDKILILDEDNNIKYVDKW